MVYRVFALLMSLDSRLLGRKDGGDIGSLELSCGLSNIFRIFRKELLAKKKNLGFGLHKRRAKRN